MTSLTTSDPPQIEITDGLPPTDVRFAVAAVDPLVVRDCGEIAGRNIFFFAVEGDAWHCANTMSKEAYPQMAIFTRTHRWETLAVAAPEPGSWVSVQSMQQKKVELMEAGEKEDPTQPPSFDNDYPWLASVLRYVTAEYTAVAEAPSVVGQYKKLGFHELENGDVILQNTCGPTAALGLLMGFNTPAGQMGMTHTALVHQTRYGGVPDRAVVWEMVTQPQPRPQPQPQPDA